MGAGSHLEELIAAAGDAGVRIDRFLARRLGQSRNACQRLIEQGAVRVNGAPARKGDVLENGSVVEARWQEHTLTPESDAPLRIVYETNHVVIVDKPAGQATVALRPDERGTLVGELLGRYPRMLGVGHGPLEPGVIHRLDTQTSGLVVAAKDADTFQKLHQALRAGHISKRYYAVVVDDSVPDFGSVSAALAPHAKNRRKVAITSPARGFEERHTSFQVVRRAHGLCLLRVSVERAYRHQIRAHLAHIGHPLLGDPLYGGAARPELAPERHALHACYVAWSGDEAETGFEVEVPLADDLEALLSGPL